MTQKENYLPRILTITVMFAAVFFLTKLFEAKPPTEQILRTANAAHPIESMADGWSGEIAYGAAYAALTPLTADDTLTENALFDPTDDYWGLPRSDDVDLVAGYCAPCHSLAIIMQQRQSADGWNYLLDWMEEKQGMAPLAAEDRAAILGYLVREFGES